MKMVALLKRLVGTYHGPEQLRFERNIASVEGQLPELDRLQENMAAIGRRIVQTQVRIRASTLSSGTSGEHVFGLLQVPEEITIMPNENEDKTVRECPFSNLRGDESQIIRRKDLLELGTTFRESLLPIKELVGHMRRQVATGDRLRLWMIVLAIASAVGVVMHIAALVVLTRTARSLQETANKVDRLEVRTSAIDNNVSVAASAAEQARVEVRSIASAQASTPTIEVLPVTDTSSRSPQLVLRVTPKNVPSAAAYTPRPAPSSVSIPVMAQ